MKQRNLKPYARRHHAKDTAIGLRSAAMLVHCLHKFGPGNFYVLTQHGREKDGSLHPIIDAAPTKRALFESIVGIKFGTMPKNGLWWCRLMHKDADAYTRNKRASRTRRMRANACRNGK